LAAGENVYRSTANARRAARAIVKNLCPVRESTVAYRLNGRTAMATRVAHDARVGNGEFGMRGIRRGITVGAFLIVALVPVAAAVTWVTVAASPVQAAVADALVTIVDQESLGRAAALPPEPAMLVLVGSGLLGLAFIVNTTRRT